MLVPTVERDATYAELRSVRINLAIHSQVAGIDLPHALRIIEPLTPTRIRAPLCEEFPSDDISTDQLPSNPFPAPYISYANQADANPVRNHHPSCLTLGLQSSGAGKFLVKSLML